MRTYLRKNYFLALKSHYLRSVLSLPACVGRALCFHFRRFVSTTTPAAGRAFHILLLRQKHFLLSSLITALVCWRWGFKVIQMLPKTLLLAIVPFVSGYTLKGCYSYDDLQSVLTSMGEYTYQTNSYCEKQCASYAVAATLDGSTCFCSNKLPSNVQSVSSSKCSTTCQGYDSEICGGDGYVSVYTNGNEDTSPLDSSSSSTIASTTSSTTSLSSSRSASTSTSTSNGAASTSTTSTTSTTQSSSQTTSTTQSSSQTTSTPSTAETSESSSKTKTEVSVITSVVTASQGAATTITQTIQSSTTSESHSGSSSATSGSGYSKQSSSGLSKGAIAGIAIGSVVGVCLIFGVFLIFFLRRRYQDNEENENGFTEKPVHNDMSMYNTAFGSQDAFNTQVPPIPFFAQENGRKRLSNGSLPDARVDNQKTLRVTNPDEFTFANESILHEGDHSYSDDESVEKFG